MVTVAKQDGVPLIAQYSAISAVSGWQSHMLGCLVPDATLDGVKAREDQAVIAPLVKQLMGG